MLSDLTRTALEPIVSDTATRNVSNNQLYRALVASFGEQITPELRVVFFKQLEEITTADTLHFFGVENISDPAPIDPENLELDYVELQSRYLDTRRK